MADIKSAREIAMEKVAGMGEATDEERLQWRYIPEGEKLAAKYFERDCNLAAELGKYEGEPRRYVARGAATIMTRNIALPKNDLIKKTNKKAMDGLKALKSDKAAVENVFSNIRRIFDHYLQNGEQQRRQAYESLKADFTAKLQQAIRQQTGAAGNMRIDVEKQPQFQEEWLKLQNQLDSQYTRLFDEYKQELQALD